MKNKLGMKVMAALLAVAIVGSFAINTKSNNLRAMEGDEGFVEEAPVEVVQEVVVTAEEPESLSAEEPESLSAEEPESLGAEEPESLSAEEPESLSAEEPENGSAEEPENGSAEEPEEAEAEEDAFDVEGAFAAIRLMDEDSARAYLASLSEENRAALKAYIAGLDIGDDEKAKLLSWFEPKQEIQPEPENERAEEPESLSAEEAEAEAEAEAEDEEDYVFDISIWFEADGPLTYGSTVVWKSSVSGVKEGDTLSYQWQVDMGNGWEDIPGATDSEYVMTVTEDNAGYSWRLIATAD